MILALLFALWLVQPCVASIVVETRAGGQNTNWYSEIAGNWQNSSSTVTAPPATGGTIGSRFATTSAATFKLLPTLVSGHTYFLSNAVPANSAASNIVVGITSTDCTGLPATTTAFNVTNFGAWRYVGTFTANSANPTITFAYSSGHTNRFYAADFLFYDTGGCLTPAVSALNGPLYAGQTSISVSGCSATASAVYVYANNDGTHATCIGTNDAPGGLTTVPVTVSPLIARQRLQASQVVNGCEGTPPAGTTGPVVGDNTNGAINLCLEFAGVNGVDNLIWLGASGRTGNFGSPPTGATAIQPNIGWQTLTWIPGTSPAWNWGTAAAYTFPSTGTANLVDIWFSSEDSGAVGPYAVYIDNIKNGDTVLKDWEGDIAGNSSFMNQPNFASTGTTALESNPNTTLCVKTNADAGTACQRMDWEWLNLGPNSVRGNLKTPVSIDLTKPITMRVLLLPANANAPALTVSQPGPIIARAGVPTNLTVVATDHTGLGTVSYSWLKNGVAIDAGNAGALTGYNSAVLHFPSPVAGDAGTYVCLVSNTVTGTFAGTYASQCNPIAVAFVKGEQQITFAPLTDYTYGDPPFALTAAASSGLPLTYSIESGPVTILGDTVTATGTGLVTVRASQAGDDNWNAAISVDQSFTVLARPVTPAITVADKEYDGGLSATITARSLVGVAGSDDVNLGTSGVAEFANKQVGPVKLVNASGFVLGGLTATNYILSADAATANAAITSRVLTVTATVPDKPYDGNRSATATLHDDRVTGDILNLLYAKVEFADKQVGPAKAASVTGIMVTGPDADNYSYNTTTSTTAAITAISLTVSGITVDNKPYDGTTNATIHVGSAAVATVLSGDEVFLDATNAVGTFRDPDVGDLKPVDVTNLFLLGTDAGNYSISALVLTADIKFALDVTGIQALDRPYDGTKVAALDYSATVLSGIQSGDEVDLDASAAVGAFADKLVGTGKAVTVTGLVLSGRDAGKYLLTAVQTNASINARPLGITAAVPDKVYDGTLAATATLSDDRVAGDALTVAFTGVEFSDPNVGPARTVTVTGISVSGLDADNYSYSASIVTNAAITRAPLIVTAQDTNRLFSAPDPVFLATYSGFVPGDSATVVSGLPSFTTSATVDSTPGIYSITPALGSLSADNYSFDTFTAGTLTVLAAESAILLNTSTNPATAGSNVTFTAVLSPVAPAISLPSGSVVFYANGVPFGTNLLAAGSTSATTDTLSVGTNLMAAVYVGDGNFLPCTNTLMQVVNPAVTLSQTNVVLSATDNYDGTLTLRFQGTPGAEYYVIRTADPATLAGNWTILDGSTNTASASDGSWSVTVTHLQPQEFYRSVAIQPGP